MSKEDIVSAFTNDAILRKISVFTEKSVLTEKANHFSDNLTVLFTYPIYHEASFLGPWDNRGTAWISKWLPVPSIRRLAKATETVMEKCWCYSTFVEVRVVSTYHTSWFTENARNEVGWETLTIHDSCHNLCVLRWRCNSMRLEILGNRNRLYIVVVIFPLAFTHFFHHLPLFL